MPFAVLLVADGIDTFTFQTASPEAASGRGTKPREANPEKCNSPSTFFLCQGHRIRIFCDQARSYPKHSTHLRLKSPLHEHLDNKPESTNQSLLHRPHTHTALFTHDLRKDGAISSPQQPIYQTTSPQWYRSPSTPSTYLYTSLQHTQLTQPHQTAKSATKPSSPCAPSCPAAPPSPTSTS